ncbi:PPE family protein [Mycobacterium sp. THU-M104]|uniref:PPE family protein n=1 Tax=Mycobacterium sp. THU-M104 TaxID=3410515 RepID=UPI003B9D46BA
MDVLAPPEVTSALIYSGPGAVSLTEASAAWQRLAVELDNVAGVYTAVLSSLIESWDGASSAAMTQAVHPFLLWLRATAQQSQQMAVSAEAAATAFSLVHSTVVHPVQVSANRTQLAQLLATNRFGSNTAAIAQTEDQYQAMWANNSAALSRYQAASAQATALPAFSSPVTIASPTAAAAQAGVVSTAGTGNAASTLFSVWSSLFGNSSGGLVNNGWFQLTNTWGNQFISSGFPINLLDFGAQSATAESVQSVGGEIGQGLAEGEAALGASEVQFSNALKTFGSAASAPTAAMGVGVTVGKLTAPPAVVGSLPASQSPVHLAAAASPLGAGDGGSSALPLPPMMMSPPVSAGSGWRKRKQQKFEDLDYGVELPKRVIHRPPSGG